MSTPATSYRDQGLDLAVSAYQRADVPSLESLYASRSTPFGTPVAEVVRVHGNGLRLKDSKSRARNRAGAGRVATACQQPGCGAQITPREKPGRPRRYCDLHIRGAAAKQRQRARDAAGIASRPPCCELAGRRGGRLSCPQHGDYAAEGSVTGMHVSPVIRSDDDDQAGSAYPRAVRRAPMTCEPPARRSLIGDYAIDVRWLMGASPSGEVITDTMADEYSNENPGHRVYDPDSRTDFDTLTDWSMTERYHHDVSLFGSLIVPKGQPDVDAYWLEAQEPGEEAEKAKLSWSVTSPELVWRGPDWPFGDAAENRVYPHACTARITAGDGAFAVAA